MKKSEPTFKLWRDRLAKSLRAYRRVRGRWPERQAIRAIHAAIFDAAKRGIRPPYQH